MAKKGDRALLEPLAIRLYADGQPLSAISEALGVSVNSLSLWKSESKAPSDELDAWERARRQKRSTIQQLRDIYEEHLEAAQQEKKGGLSTAKIDALIKLGSMVLRAEQHEAAAAVRDGSIRGAMFLDFVKDLISWSGKNDPDLLQALERNFDDLITWGQEKYTA